MSRRHIDLMESWTAPALLCTITAVGIARYFFRRASTGTEQLHGSQEVMMPEPILLRLLSDDDLAIVLVRCMTPRTAGRCGLTCRTAADRLQQRQLARLWHEYEKMPLDNSPDFDERLRNQGLECCRPGEHGFPDTGYTDSQVQSRHIHATADEHHGVWSFHRLFLWAHTPVFSVVQFAEMSDQTTPEIDLQLYDVAQWLDKHPGLQIMIIGHAVLMNEGDEIIEEQEQLGSALAQARAARIRQRLLFQMISSHGHRYWRDWVEPSSGSDYDKASEGVRAPDAGRGHRLDGGFLGLDENRNAKINGSLDDVLQFYNPGRWAIGRRVRAEGRFPDADCEWSTMTRQLQLDDAAEADMPALCDVVEISVVGFEPHSHLAF